MYMVVSGQAGKDLATLIRHYEYGRRSYGWVFDLCKFRNCMIYLPSDYFGVLQKLKV
jgi:hypothetical protein